MRFQPSSLSPSVEGYYAHHNGALALANQSTSSVLATGGLSAVAQALKSKTGKLAYHVREAAKKKVLYDKCKSKNKSKGKPVYPMNPGKGPFFSDCRGPHKDWKHHEEEAAKLAKELREEMDSKGQLTPEFSNSLQVIEQGPLLSARDLREQDRRELKDEMLEEQGNGCGKQKDRKGKNKNPNRRFDGSKCKHPHKKKGSGKDGDLTEEEALVAADAELPPLEEYVKPPPSDYTMPLVIGGVILLLGGIGYVMTRPSEPRSRPVSDEAA